METCIEFVAKLWVWIGTFGLQVGPILLQHGRLGCSGSGRGTQVFFLLQALFDLSAVRGLTGFFKGQIRKEIDININLNVDVPGRPSRLKHQATTPKVAHY